MGTVDRNYRCQSCSGTRETCPGHFGRMFCFTCLTYQRVKWKHFINNKCAVFCCSARSFTAQTAQQK